MTRRGAERHTLRVSSFGYCLVNTCCDERLEEFQSSGSLVRCEILTHTPVPSY